MSLTALRKKIRDNFVSQKFDPFSADEIKDIRVLLSKNELEPKAFEIFKNDISQNRHQPFTLDGSKALGKSWYQRSSESLSFIIIRDILLAISFLMGLIKLFSKHSV